MSRRLGVNPDNIATPVAAALGDLVTLALLSVLATIFHRVGCVLQIIILLLYGLVALYCARWLFVLIFLCQIICKRYFFGANCFPSE